MPEGYPEERDGVVAILDALGMREAGRRSNYRNFMVLLRDHLRQLKHSAAFGEQLSGWLREAEADLPPLEQEIVGFQDTFVVCFWPKDPSTDPRRVLASASTLLGPFMADVMDDPIYPFFFRGTIEVGRFSVWDGLVLGEAYIEAFDSQEKTQWAGVMAGPKASELLNESKDDPAQSYFFAPYSVPMKCGHREDGFALTWPHWVQGMNRPLLREALKKRIEMYEREDIKAKYQNTLAFAEWYWQNYDQDAAQEDTP